jgi:dihydroorotase
VHCEDETTIQNLEKYKAEFGDIPVTAHHLIRSEEACYISLKTIALAKKTERACMFSSFYCQRNGFVY